MGPCAKSRRVSQAGQRVGGSGGWGGQMRPTGAHPLKGASHPDGFGQWSHPPNWGSQSSGASHCSSTWGRRGSTAWPRSGLAATRALAVPVRPRPVDAIDEMSVHYVGYCRIEPTLGGWPLFPSPSPRPAVRRSPDLAPKATEGLPARLTTLVRRNAVGAGSITGEARRPTVGLPAGSGDPRRARSRANAAPVEANRVSHSSGASHQFESNGSCHHQSRPTTDWNLSMEQRCHPTLSKTTVPPRNNGASQGSRDSIDCGGRVRQMTRSPQEPV